MANIFLSYSQIDDVPEPQPGWIRDFHARLSQQLAIATGVKHEIWFDRLNHRQNNRLAEILREVAQASILITVLGPPHINSQWCRDELSTFLGRNPAYPRPLNMPPRDLSFVFSVDKFPLPNGERALKRALDAALPQNDPLHDRLEQVLPYVFYEEGAAPRTYNPNWLQDQGYHLALAKLVWNLAQRLASSTRLALFGSAESKVLPSIRKGTADYGLRPLGEDWPVALAARQRAINDALAECELAVVAFEGDDDDDRWELFDRIVAHQNVRRCMVWLDKSDEALRAGRFKALRDQPPAKCELYEAKKFKPAQLVQAVRENLEELEKHPQMNVAPPAPGVAPRKPVHVVYMEEDEAIAQQAFADAQQFQVATVDVRVKSLSELSAHANNAKAMLIASADESRATVLMKRVAARLETDQRGGVGFSARAPLLEGNFRWLGRNVSGIFQTFPG